MNTKKIANEIAVLKRKASETKNATLKETLNKKIARLKADLEASKMSAPQLAKHLLKSQARVKSFTAKEFDEAIHRLSKKSEYSFLKGMSKTQIKDDLEREAKRPGWRFRGRDNFKKPTKDDVRKLRGKGVYYENRPNRSDVTRSVKLQEGGLIQSKEMDGEYYDKVRDFEGYEKLVKDMGYDSVLDFETKTGTNFAEIRNKWFTVMNDRVFFMSKAEYGGRMAKGGSVIEMRYRKSAGLVDMTPREVWEAWNNTQRKHFLKDHKDEILEAGGANFNVDSLLNSKWGDLDIHVRGAIERHVQEDKRYSKGGGVEQYGNGALIKRNKTEDYYYLVSNISEKWDTTDKITQDINNFIISCVDASGNELRDEVVAAIQKGIESAKKYK